MDVSPNVLRKETVQTLKAVQAIIDDLGPDERTTLEAAPLFLAKAQCLQTLVLLRDMR